MWILILKNDTNELIYKTETDLTDIENKLMVTKREAWGGGGINQDLGIKIHTLLYIRKDLLYSTGNYIQYSMINHNGKEYLKKNVYICTTESLCFAAEINTTL